MQSVRKSCDSKPYIEQILGYMYYGDYNKLSFLDQTEYDKTRIWDSG